MVPYANDLDAIMSRRPNDAARVAMPETRRPKDVSDRLRAISSGYNYSDNQGITINPTLGIRYPGESIGQGIPIAVQQQQRQPRQPGPKLEVYGKSPGESKEEAMARAKAMGMENPVITDRGYGPGRLNNPKFEAARAARDKKKALARQRQFARAQMRSGEMFNDDGSADLLGSLAAQAARRDPRLAIAAAGAREQNMVARDRLGLDETIARAELEMKQSEIDELLAQGEFERGTKFTTQTEMEQARIDAANEANTDQREFNQFMQQAEVQRSQVLNELSLLQGKMAAATSEGEQKKTALEIRKLEQHLDAIDKAGGELGFESELQRMQMYPPERPVTSEEYMSRVRRMSQATPEERRIAVQEILDAGSREEQKEKMRSLGMTIDDLQEISTDYSMFPLFGRDKGAGADERLSRDRAAATAKQLLESLLNYNPNSSRYGQ